MATRAPSHFETRARRCPALSRSRSACLRSATHYWVYFCPIPHPQCVLRPRRGAACRAPSGGGLRSKRSTGRKWHLHRIHELSGLSCLHTCTCKAPIRSATRSNFWLGCQAYHRFAQQRTRKDGTEVSPTLTNPKQPPVIVKRLGR